MQSFSILLRPSWNRIKTPYRLIRKATRHRSFVNSLTSVFGDGYSQIPFACNAINKILPTCFSASTQKTQCPKSSQYSEKSSQNKVCTTTVSHLDRSSYRQKIVCAQNSMWTVEKFAKTCTKVCGCSVPCASSLHSIHSPTSLLCSHFHYVGSFGQQCIVLLASFIL